MIDKNFHKKLGPHKLGFVAKSIDCELNTSNEDILIDEINSIEAADIGELTFLSNKKYLPEFKNTKATACIVHMDLPIDEDNKVILLRSKNPYLSYTKAIDLFYSSKKEYNHQIMPSAYVSKSAKIGENCYIGHNVVIEDNVSIGNNCIIEAGAVIDSGVEIGNNAKIYSNVTISHANIGDNVIILSGARIGQDGFGFATSLGKHYKIYHTGKVLIGNDVEIGANTTIDRGSMNDTIIEDRCRIDNLVQVGHNVRIGRGSIIVAQVGIAGSSKIGNYCALGGQVGISGHLNIADKVQIAGQGGVIQNINEEGLILGGTPAVPIRDWHKHSIIMKKLIRDK